MAPSMFPTNLESSISTPVPQARLPARMMAKSMPSAATASQSMIPLWPDTSTPWAK